jgi:hypothetical protein
MHYRLIAAAAGKAGLAFDALQTEAIPMPPKAIIAERGVYLVPK